MKLHLFFGSAALLLAAACGSNGPTTLADSGAFDGPTPQDATTDSSHPPSDSGGPVDSGSTVDAAPACNAIVDVAALITANQTAANPPNPMGGIIADGTYALTDATVYTGPGGPTGGLGQARVTLQIQGTTVQIVDDGDPNRSKRSTATLTTMGTSLIAIDTCPDSKATVGSYTASSTTLLIFQPAGSLPDGGSETLVETYTKQ